MGSGKKGNTVAVDKFAEMVQKLAPKKTKAPAATGAIEEQNETQLTGNTLTPAQKISNLPSHAPAGLRDLPGWLIWRYEHHPGEPKPRKVPYYTHGGRRHGVQGRPEDRRQLTTFDAAKAAATRRGFEGVGFALMPDFNVVALDFDNCMVEGGVHPDVERLVAGTYAEYSPSGEGVRAFMLGNLGNGKSNNVPPFGFETFSTKGFVTFTGNRLDITDLLGTENALADVTDDVRELCAQRFARKVSDLSAFEPDDPLMAYEPVLGLSEDQIRICLEALPKDLAYDDWIDIGMAVHHETGGERFDLWDEWSSSSPKYTTSDYGRMKWDSFGRNGVRPVTARTLVKMANENGAGIDLSVASPDDFEATANASAPDEKLRFRVVPAGEFSRAQAPGWIIKGVLPRAELVVLFGESGSGKSFLALDIGAAIARGIEWRGNRTKQGRVVYIAAEGGGGFRNRLRAYEIHHEVPLDTLPFGIIHATPNFLQKADAVDVAKAIAAGGPADVVIVDTFAQVIPGANENAAEDIGKALVHCRGIHKATGAVVILVHHAGKDPTRGARGWSGLRAAADAEIEVLRMTTGRMARISKQKDGDDGREWGFDLQRVPIGVDEDGDVIDSCVIKETEVPLTGKIGSRGRRPLGVWERRVQEVVEEFAFAQNGGIETDQVIAEVLRRAPPVEEGKRDTRKQQAKRALEALCQGDDAPYFLEDGCLSVL